MKKLPVKFYKYVEIIYPFLTHKLCSLQLSKFEKEWSWLGARSEFKPFKCRQQQI